MHKNCENAQSWGTIAWERGGGGGMALAPIYDILVGVVG
jgi:hypothetical protein